MNPLAHFLLGLLVVDIVFGNAERFLFYILIFSVLIDLDHIIYISSVKGDLFRQKFGSGSRSRFHELYGLTLLSLGISILSVHDLILMQVIGLSIILHYASDFLSGKTRPFYPFSEKEVFLHICPQKYRLHAEIVLTILLGVMVWLRGISWSL